MKKISEYILEIVVFICGASLMILELVGSRVLAPYVGTSTIVWTSLIGIILGCLSLGYWWGGRLADKRASEKILSFVIFLSAFFVFLIVIGDSIVLSFIRLNISSIYLGATAGTIMLFAIPSFLLGIVSPYAVKLKMKSLNVSGRTVGNLYAISTLGSISGTFLAGFVLIPLLGTTKILYLISIFLVIASLLISLRGFFKIKVITLLLYVVCASIPLSFNVSVHAKGLIDIDTQYSRVWIYSSKAPDVSRPIRRLTTDPFSVQSAMFLDRDDGLVFKYAKYFRLAEHFKPDLQKTLMFGGAAYSFPRDFLKRNPEGEITVVEIDPQMTKIAQKYFNLKKDSRMKIEHIDGRVFLEKNKDKFDVVYIDAFTSHLSIPYQLTTREAVRKIYGALEDDGVVIVNLISAITGDKSKFLQAEVKTYKEIFPQVYVFPIEDTKENSVQNLILVALKSDQKPVFESENEELNEYLKKLMTKEIEINTPTLTDDYAPVNHYLKKFIK